MRSRVIQQPSQAVGGHIPLTPQAPQTRSGRVGTRRRLARGQMYLSSRNSIIHVPSVTCSLSQCAVCS